MAIPPAGLKPRRKIKIPSKIFVIPIDTGTGLQMLLAPAFSTGATIALS